MRWTADNDQLLLAMILNVHDISVDGPGVASLWPTCPGEQRPTARAITERVFKIRKTAGAVGGGSSANISATDSPATKTPTTTTTTTTITPATKTKKTPRSKKTPVKPETAKPNNKRKATSILPSIEHSSSEDDGGDFLSQTPSKKPRPAKQPTASKHKAIKREPMDNDILTSSSTAYSPAGTTPANDDAESDDPFRDNLDVEGIYGMLDDEDVDATFNTNLGGLDGYFSSSL